MSLLFVAAVLFAAIMSTVLTRTRASHSDDQKSLALAQEALNEILTRAGPIAGESPISNYETKDNFNTGTDEGCSKYQKTCNWMAKFADSTKLVQMNLPGTHDTSTCNTTLISSSQLLIGSIEFRELLRRDSSFTHSLYRAVSRTIDKELCQLTYL